MTVGQAWTGITATDSPAYTVTGRVIVVGGTQNSGGQHLPGAAAWLVREWRDTAELQYHLTNHSAGTPQCVLDGAFRARWSRERAHQRLKEELVPDHFEGRAWNGLPHHALRTTISCTFLQYRRLPMTDHPSWEGRRPAPRDSPPVQRPARALRRSSAQAHAGAGGPRRPESLCTSRRHLSIDFDGTISSMTIRMRDEHVRLRHFVFFQTLAQAPDESASVWRTTKAGLMVLRTIDMWAAYGPVVITGNERGIQVIRRAVMLIDAGDPLGDLIMNVLDAIWRAPQRSPSELIPYLVAYADGLEQAEQWALAADVYHTISDTCAQPGLDTPAIVDAHMRRGACLGTLAQWTAASAAYRMAGRLATLIGDPETARRARTAAAHVRRLRVRAP